MKYFIYVLVLFITCNAFAQSRVQKLLPGDNISTININGNTVFKITIGTTDANTISIESNIEGENNEQVILNTETKNDTLYVSSQYQPLFTNPDDKLGAHKVISIELVLNIPLRKSIYVSSDIASVFVNGEYNKATIELINGHCVLKDFKGQATVNTIQGDIQVFTNFDKVDAFTKNGLLSTESVTIGNSMLSLYSINGNITVIKSQ